MLTGTGNVTFVENVLCSRNDEERVAHSMGELGRYGLDLDIVPSHLRKYTLPPTSTSDSPKWRSSVPKVFYQPQNNSRPFVLTDIDPHGDFVSEIFVTMRRLKKSFIVKILLGFLMNFVF